MAFASVSLQEYRLLFLIQYDRRAGRIVHMERFTNDQRDLAAETRLNLELELQRRRISREGVVLDAASEEALRRTHGRHCEDVEDLLAAMAGAFEQGTSDSQSPQISTTERAPRSRIG